MSRNSRYIAEATIAVSSASVALSSQFSAAQLAEADVAYCYLHTDAIFFRLSGAAATADTSSHYKAAASEFTLIGNVQIQNFRAIRETTDAALKVTLFKE